MRGRVTESKTAIGEQPFNTDVEKAKEALAKAEEKVKEEVAKAEEAAREAGLLPAKKEDVVAAPPEKKLFASNLLLPLLVIGGIIGVGYFLGRRK
jgi:hypothetical protein